MDWIPADGKSIKMNATQRVGNVFFLAVFNVTKEDDDQLYVCQFFSADSPHKSDSQQSGSIPAKSALHGPVKDFKLWAECYAVLAGVLVLAYPEKAPS